MTESIQPAPLPPRPQADVSSGAPSALSAVGVDGMASFDGTDVVLTRPKGHRMKRTVIPVVSVAAVTFTPPAEAVGVFGVAVRTPKGDKAPHGSNLLHFEGDQADAFRVLADAIDDARPQTPVPLGQARDPRPFSALTVTAFTLAVLALLSSWMPLFDILFAVPFAIVGATFLGFAMHATRRNGPRRGRRLTWAALAILLSAALVFTATWFAYGKNLLDDTIESAETEVKASSAEAGLWGDQIHIEIDSFTESAVLDDDLPPGIVFSYTFRNNSTVAVSPVKILDFKAYQDGYELDEASSFEGPVEGCGSSKSISCFIDLSDFYKVQPDSSTKLLKGFQLLNDRDPVTIEVSGGSADTSGRKLIHTFTLQ